MSKDNFISELGHIIYLLADLDNLVILEELDKTKLKDFTKAKNTLILINERLKLK